jgi:hypothetical protein
VQLFLKVAIPTGIAGIQATGMASSLPSLALDTRFQAGMTRFFASVANKLL